MPSIQDSPKLCECGCGRPTRIAPRNSKERGVLKGQPYRFLQGHKLQPTLEERFWSKVDTSGGPDACHLWTGAKDADGYGVLVFRIGKRYRTFRASRIAYEISVEPMPPDKMACHKCDNPSCCNYRHLFAGSPKDNQIDMTLKGRGRTGIRNGHYTKPEATPRGEQVYKAKLTESDVLNIRKCYHEQGVSRQELARRYSVTDGAIWFIVNNKSWKHLL